MIKEFVHIENLYKIYKKKSIPAINNLILSLEKEKIHGILGPNGAGKTTLIKILTGLLKPDEGEILINDLNVLKNKKYINSIIGLIPQEIALYQNLTAYENLNYFASQYNIPKSARKEIIANYLKKIDLFDRKNDLIKHFSGGMKRRINLIAGLLHNPKLLILDEPTVGIDVQSKNVIINLLEDLNNDGMTIIYTSHLIDEAEKICDNVYIINKGKIVEQGTPGSLVEKYPKSNNLEEVFIELTSINEVI